MIDLLTEESEVIHHALEWTTKVHIAFAKAQLQAGAHATSMGDSYASPNLVSPAIYKQYALDYEKHVVSTVQTEEQHYSVHICGDTGKIIREMGETGARILEVDWKLNMKLAREVVPERCTLMGNIDPIDPLYLGTPEQVLNKAKEIFHAVRGKGLILSSGCAIGPNAKPENIAAMVEAAKRYGTAEQIMELQAL